MVNIPVAIVNAILALWLIVAQWRKPTIAQAKSLYRYSVAFPYLAGAVAGVQLVAALTFGSYTAP
jgi:hypothetical protein